MTKCYSIISLLVFNLVLQVDAQAKNLDIEALTARAQSGELSAQVQLADHYRSGGGSVKDMRNAAHWYREAANRGDPESQFQLSYFYMNGRGGIQRDEAEGARLIRMAANQGHVLAQVNLGSFYRKGLGVNQDHTQAVFWYEKALSKSKYKWSSIAYYLGGLYRSGTGVKKNLPVAIKWFEYSAKQMHPPSIFQLGLMHQYGEGTPVDFVKAAEYYTSVEKAEYDITGQDADIVIQGGDVKLAAKANLAYLYWNGLGVPQDKSKAFNLYKIAAVGGNFNAQHNIGILYGLGEGVKRSHVKSEQWLTKAAQSGYSISQVALGYFYYQGKAVPRDTTRAIHWFNEAAKQGNNEGTRMLNQVQASLNARSPASTPRYSEKAMSRQRNAATEKVTAGDIIGGLAIIAGLIWANNAMSDSAQSNNTIDSKSVNNNNSEYIRCYNQVIDRIAECKVVPQYDCSMTGCPDDRIECDKGWSGRACESNSAGAYYINTYGLKPFFCDTENRKNKDSDINVVINNICLQK